jgi:hypothetical protein
MSITPGIFFVVEILDLRFVPAIDNTVVYFKKKGRMKFSLHAAIHPCIFIFFFIPEFCCYCLHCVYGVYG